MQTVQWSTYRRDRGQQCTQLSGLAYHCDRGPQCKQFSGLAYHRDRGPQCTQFSDLAYHRDRGPQTGCLIPALKYTSQRHHYRCGLGCDCAETLKQAVCFCLLVGCLTSQQHAGVSQGRICSDNFTCCHTEIEVADQTFHLTQSQDTDTGPTSPSADPRTPGAWQSSHWSANF